MNSLSLKKAAVLLALALLPLLGIAQPHHHHGPAPQFVPPHDSMAFHKPGDYHAGPMLSLPNGLTTYKVCQTPMGFALIDSIDNSIDLVIVSHDAEKTISRTAYYTVDTYKGRYDLNRILRPVSLQAVGNDIVFLATSSDSSFIGVLQSTAEADADGHQTYQLTLSASYGFPCHSDVFEYNPRERQIQVVGFNPTGYDINILDLAGGLDHLDQATLTPFHYHVPKQAEKIKVSDPYGVGLTIVAVLVVFFALICIALVLKGFGKIVSHIERHKSDDNQSRRLQRLVFGTDEEVYVAIATAIYMYQDDLHDDEDNVLTIQKVERAWTPWNAKFYNMNQYFNRRNR